MLGLSGMSFMSGWGCGYLVQFGSGGSMLDSLLSRRLCRHGLASMVVLLSVALGLLLPCGAIIRNAEGTEASEPSASEPLELHSSEIGCRVASVSSRVRRRGMSGRCPAVRVARGFMATRCRIVTIPPGHRLANGLCAPLRV